MNPSTSRRAVLTALSVFPLALAFGCGKDDEPTPQREEPEAGAPAGLSATERARLRSLADAYVLAQTTHDLDAAMTFFSAESTMTVNGRAFEGEAAIRAVLVELGVGGGGGLEASRVDAEHWSFTDEAILVEGRTYGRHVGELAGFAATNQDVELAFASFLEFDGDGRLTACRTTSNLLYLVRPV